MKFIKDLEKHCAMERELAALARVGHSLLRDGKLEELDHTWSKRRVLFARICKSHRKLAPVLTNWDREMASLPEEQRRQCGRIVADIREVSGQVLEHDAKSAQLLEQVLSNKSEEMMRIKSGKKLIRAYNSAGRITSGLGTISKTG